MSRLAQASRGLGLSDAALKERGSLFNFGLHVSGSTTRPKFGPTSGRSSTRGTKKKLVTWTHDFICIANTNQDKSPTALERSQLITAGLGKKSLNMLECGDSADLHADIIDAFLQLADAGGYELFASLRPWGAWKRS